uniref:SUZ domain-containing protein n=1 Tax=Leersia perrieri TaxID=77586 RepID=A0A0D9WGH7_9ORYZ
MSSGAASPPPPVAAAEDGRVMELDGHVDPFLVEALDNPRHRLMVLRMEMDIQKFMQNPQLHEFEFQHFPTSYLRCAAHRVAQHYGLETTVADSLVDGSVSKIVAKKTPESKFPVIALSEVPSKQARNEHEAAEKLKFVICQRPKAFQNDAGDAGAKNGAAKTVEERIEEYNKARERIFNGSISGIEGTIDLGALSVARDEPVNIEPPVDENKVNTMNSRSRVAVFKDTEKDRSDPDYDRTYKRYVRGPVNDFNVSPGGFNFVVPQFMQYGVGYMQSANMSRNQPSVYFGQPDLSMGSPSGTAIYPQWPTPAMIYPHCYDNLGHMVSQVPVYQSFNHG